MPSITRSQAVKACREDFNYWGRMLKPDEVEYDFPDFFLAIFQLITRNIHEPELWERYVIGIPRGHAKTTFLELIVIWVITFTDLKSFLIVCATEDLAEDILASLVQMLEEPDYVTLFGNWKNGKVRKTNDRLETVFRDRRLKIEAKGALSKSIRGKKQVSRPQFYLLDDVQVREEAESPTIFRKLLSWTTTTLLKGRHPKRALALYCGNKYPTQYCLLSNLEEHPRWTSAVTGALLSDGTALWEQVRSKKSLLAEYEDDLFSGVPESFVSEMLNGKSAGLGSGIRVDKIPRWEPQPTPEVGRFIILDFATDKATADQQVLMPCSLYADDTVDINEVHEHKLAHDDLAEEAVMLALRTQTPLICYEDVGAQHIMLKEITKSLTIRGLLGQIHVKPVSPKGESKTSRIVNHLFKNLIPSKRTGESPRIRIRDACFAQVTNQIATFDMAKVNNVDDILDSGAYIPQVVNNPEYRQLSLLPVNSFLDDSDEEAMTVSGHLSF